MLHMMGEAGWTVGLCGEGVPALSNGSSGEKEKQVGGNDGTEDANTKKSKNKRKRRAGNAAAGNNCEESPGSNREESEQQQQDDPDEDLLKATNEPSPYDALEEFNNKQIARMIEEMKEKDAEKRRAEDERQKKMQELEKLSKKKGKKAQKAAVELAAEREKDRAAEEKKEAKERAREERLQEDIHRAESRRPDGPDFVYVMVRPCPRDTRLALAGRVRCSAFEPRPAPIDSNGTTPTAKKYEFCATLLGDALRVLLTAMLEPRHTSGSCSGPRRPFKVTFEGCARRFPAPVMAELCRICKAFGVLGVECTWPKPLGSDCDEKHFDSEVGILVLIRCSMISCLWSPQTANHGTTETYSMFVHWHVVVVV